MIFGCFYIDEEGRVWALSPNGEWRVILESSTRPGNHHPGKTLKEELDMSEKKGKVKKRWLH